ncbi:tripartite tricarboxylate transporter TctB family protein [Devosia psychrophila]|uniref:Putative tricarboxylic transport membrane protein n=1 Tax=Devosia psychrophila TaxID=728005 RepID=A0A0F5PWZ4_9HYPH|nr:tripartite tricarboxylate transporter TctB family protein [Devosia psychrophila]KKC33115.1 hypothetical protein WH91_10280 [Devosia psychrophila]SFD10429.1 putative tricarboxylic transport membrane protein [Devosia psychrophila]
MINSPFNSPRRLDRPTAAIGITLLALAALLVRDAFNMSVVGGYGVGPSAMTYAVASGLVVLGFGHIISAFRPTADTRERADWKGTGHVVGGIAILILAVYFRLGFIIPMGMLFTLTARGFGRRAFLADFALGISLGAVIYLAFAKLLALSLPRGPLEQLLAL